MRLFEAVLWVVSFIFMVGLAYFIVGEFLPMADQRQQEPCFADIPKMGKTKPC